MTPKRGHIEAVNELNIKWTVSHGACDAQTILVMSYRTLHLLRVAAVLVLAQGACPPSEELNREIDAVLSVPVEPECARPQALPFLRDRYGLAVVLERSSVAIERGGGRVATVSARALACPTVSNAARSSAATNATFLRDLHLWARVVGAGVAAANADIELRFDADAPPSWDLRIDMPAALAVRGAILEVVVATLGGRVEPTPVEARGERVGELWRGTRRHIPARACRLRARRALSPRRR